MSCDRKLGPFDCCSVVQGDCLELLKLLPDGSVDAVITSPPYNLGEGCGDKGGLRVGHKKSLWAGSKLRGGYSTFTDDMPYSDYVAWQKEVLTECWRTVTAAVFYNHKPRVVNGALRLPLALNPDLPLRQIIIWNRDSGFNFSPTFYVPSHEWVMLFARETFSLTSRGASGVGDVWDIRPNADAEHPASFPEELPSIAIETSGAGTILDPFLGSGTTAVAAKKLGRHFLGFEISPEYCEIARKRIALVEAQPNLFAPKPEQQPLEGL